MSESTQDKQLLHLVFGGELESPDGIRFRDLEALDVVGIFPDYASAVVAWASISNQIRKRDSGDQIAVISGRA